MPCSAMQETVLILCALRFEATALKQLEKTTAGVFHVCVTGVGPEAAKAGALKWIQKYQPTWIVGCGVCGSLRPDLSCGQVMVPSEFVRDDDEAVLQAEPLPHDLARTLGLSGATRANEALGGRILSVHKIAATPDEKRKLREKYAADVVDEESYTWAQVAKASGIPFSAIRVVLDEVDDTLPTWSRPRTWLFAGTVIARSFKSRQRLAGVGRRFVCVRW